MNNDVCIDSNTYSNTIDLDAIFQRNAWLEEELTIYKELDWPEVSAAID